MIILNDIKKTYHMGDQVVHALAGVSLTVQQGEFVAIMGPSGSGKSTLMHLLGLLDKPESGSFQLLGREVSLLSEDELAILRRKTVGFIFQQFNLLARTTAVENVALPQLYSQQKLDLVKAEKHLTDVGLGSRTLHKPNELSGGQQQRVAIARALINDPKIILADEPTGNLDSKSEHEIMELLKKLNSQGITIIVVTHEEEIAKYARRVIRMRDGKIQSDETTHPTPENTTQSIPREIPSIDLGKRTFSTVLIEFSAHFKEGVKALLANKVRTALSMLGILIGVAAVIAMLALGRGAQQSIETQLASLGSNLLVLRPGNFRAGGVSLGTGSVTRLSIEDAEAVAASVKTAKQVAPEIGARAQITYADKNWNTQIVGTTAAYAPMRATEPVVGRFFDDEENKHRARVAVIGLTIVDNLFGKKDPIGEYIKINKVTFQVIGILPEKGATSWRDQDDTIMVPILTAMHRLLGKDYIDEIDVEVAGVSQMESTTDELLSLMNHRHRVPPSQTEAFQVRNMADIQSALSESSKTMSLLLASIAAISLLVGGIGIMNIMLVSVTERTREIGLRKALGARRQDILAQFLIEAILVSVVGGLLGIILGCSMTFAMSAFAHWTTSVSIDSITLSTVFSATIGILFGIWPAKKAASLDPIVALRHE